MRDLEHSAITMALATGYPQKQKDPDRYCDYCGMEIYPGEEYLDTGETWYCMKCVDRMMKIAGED